MFVVAILAGLAMMAVIAFGPLLSVVLNNLALIGAVVGGAGVLALGIYAVSRLRQATTTEPEVAEITPEPARLRPAVA